MTDINQIAITSPDIRQDRLTQLRELLPDLFDGEGQLDEKALRSLISNEAGVAAERFTFEWAGKQKSKRFAFTPSKATLQFDAKRSLNRDGSQNKDGDTIENNTSKNLIIEGDNLEVLKLLQTTYFEKVKCIYIDPPYNTGKDFIYPDDFSESKKEYWEKNGTEKEGVRLMAVTESSGRRHSEWLNFMQSRLLLARNILSKDGVIFISIDNNEVHNLRKLCDEIFGEDNFISLIANVNNPKGRSDDNFVATAHEYLLVYARSKCTAALYELPAGQHIIKRFNKSDENGYIYREIDLRKTGNEDRKEDREDMFYYFYYNNGINNLICSKEKREIRDYIEIIPLRKDGSFGRWRWGFKTTENGLDKLIAKYMPIRKIWGIFEKDYGAVLDNQL